MTTLGNRPKPTSAPEQVGVLRRWRVALGTGNAPDGPIDPVTRWILLVRASVLPMTITAGLVAGLLAWWNDDGNVDVGLWALAAVGIVLAHMANNLMNDLFDLQVGTDDAQYPRALYAPHPVLSGMTTRMGLGVRAIVLNLIDLAILVVLVIERGWPIAAFALGGFALSVAYTAPPLRLKKHGLGEPTVLVVWGPLMVGGTYYAAVGNLPWEIVLASLPYALLCTAVLMGKHIDKIPWDEPDGTRTLPVIIGERRARALTRAMMVAFYPLIAILAAMGTVPILSLVCVVGVAKLVQVWKPFLAVKPDAPSGGLPDLAAVVRSARVRAHSPRRRRARARNVCRGDPEHLAVSNEKTGHDQGGRRCRARCRSSRSRSGCSSVTARWCTERAKSSRVRATNQAVERRSRRWRRAPSASQPRCAASVSLQGIASPRSPGTPKSTSRRTSRSLAWVRCCTPSTFGCSRSSSPTLRITQRIASSLSTPA